MTKKLSYGLVLSITIAGLLYVSVFDGLRKEPTPLSGFSAPFVFGRFQIPSDNPLTAEGVALGRRLFYDPRLSSDNSVSCSTCHKQELAFTDGLKTSVGVSGRPLAFNSMSLTNLMWGPQRFFWNGRSQSLENQALQPILHPDEMAQDMGELLEELSQDKVFQQLFDVAYGEISERAIASALSSFQRTLISSNSRYDQYLRGEVSLNKEAEAGRKLFMAHPDAKISLRGGNCIDCHSQFLTSGFSTGLDGFSNNGLDATEKLLPGLATVTGKPAHRGLFKTPTLRNIAMTAPYMHDGRFDTLEDVLNHYDHGIVDSDTLSPLIAEADNQPLGEKKRMVSLNLTAAERKAIIAFLHTLTDEEFLTNKQFSNPFEEGER